MLEKQKEWDRAVQVYALGLAYAEDAALHDGPGYCLSKAGRFSEAEYHSRRAVELDPDNAAYANDLGHTLIEQGRFQEARTLLERALRLGPLTALARPTRGWLTPDRLQRGWA